MKYIALFLGIIGAAGGYIWYESDQMTSVGADLRTFISTQLAVSPIAGYVLSTDGTNNSWIPAAGGPGGGSNWTVVPGGLRTSTTTDFAQAAYFVATSTTGTSTFAGDITMQHNKWLITHGIRGDASDGLYITSNNGTNVADFGIGNTANSSFFGGVNIDGSVRIATTTNGVLQATAGTLSATTTGNLTETVTGLEFSATRALIGGSSILSLTSGYSIPLTNSLLTASASTTGNLAFWSGNQTIGNVATGTLTETITGLELNATRSLVGGSAILALTAGYNIPLTASTTQWTAAFASTTAMTPTYTRGLFSNTATGLTYTGATGITALTAGYNIPLSASTTNWNDFYTTPSTRITAGTGIDWSGNTLNGVYTAGDALTLTGEDFDFDGGASPAGELGGTWASPTIDDSLAVTSWNLTTPTLTSFFGTPCTGNNFLQDISDTGSFTCAEATGSGGGGGSLSTTTDIIGVPTNTPELVSYVLGDVMFGGSASTTAEFQFDDDGSQFIISSSSANATGTILTNNNAQALRFGDDDGDMIEMYFGTAGDIILRALGTITDWVFNMNLYVQTGKNIFLGAVQWNSGDNIDGEAIANDTIDDDSIDFADVTLVDFTNDAGFITNDTSISLTADVTGILPQANGGTGTTTQLVWSRTIASTSIEFINDSLMPLTLRLDGGTITRIVCKVDGGTSKIIAIEDASGNSSEDITCGTTPTTDDGSITNATFTSLEEMYIDFGAVSGAVDHVSISVYK
jgi:hypothetical protein